MVLFKNISFAFIMLVSVPAAADPVFPVLQGKPLLDAANVISSEDEQIINQRLTEITQKSKHQIMVLITPSLEGEAIADYGYKAGRHYRIGNRDSDDGVLITIAPTEKKARIDTGYGIESSLTDAISGKIVNEVMIPRFKSKDWAGGINAGLDKIADVIVPLSPEQIAIQQRQEANRLARLEKQRNHTLNVLFYIGLIGLGIGGAIALYLYLTRDNCRLKREQREAAELALALARQAEVDRLRKIQQAQIEKAAQQRRDRLNAMSPHAREAFLQRERDVEAAALRRTREQEAERAKKEKARREEADRQSNDTSFIVLGSDSGGKRNQDTSDDSTSFNFSGDGGSFGGGGAEGSWDD